MEPNHCCFACRDTPVQSFSCSCYILSWGGTTQHFLSISVCLPLFPLWRPPPPQTLSLLELRWATNWKRCEYYIPRQGIITVSTSRFCATFSFHLFIIWPLLLQRAKLLLLLLFTWQTVIGNKSFNISSRDWYVVYVGQDVICMCPNPKFSNCYCSTLCTLSLKQSAEVQHWSFSSKPVFGFSYLLQSNILSQYFDTSMVSDFRVISINCTCLREHYSTATEFGIKCSCQKKTKDATIQHSVITTDNKLFDVHDVAMQKATD